MKKRAWKEEVMIACGRDEMAKLKVHNGTTLHNARVTKAKIVAFFVNLATFLMIKCCSP
jgi:hypothetical protein